MTKKDTGAAQHYVLSAIITDEQYHQFDCANARARGRGMSKAQAFSFAIATIGSSIQPCADAEILRLRGALEELKNASLAMGGHIKRNAPPIADFALAVERAKYVLGKGKITLHESQQDSTRLDWLEAQSFPWLTKTDDGFTMATDQVCRSNGQPTARAAIDAAMSRKVAR